MKKFLFFFILAGACNMHEPGLNGAFEKVNLADNSSSLEENDTSIHNITIFKDDYWTSTFFKRGSMLKCSGGTYKIMKGKCIQTFNFDSQDTTTIGKTDTFDFDVQDSKYFVELNSKNGGLKRNVNEYGKITTAEPLRNSSLEGVWKMKSGQGGYTMNSDEGIQIFSYPEFVRAFYNVKRKKFGVIYSGTYQFDSSNLIETINSKSADVNKGTTMEWEVKKLPGKEIQLFDIDSFYDEEIWIRTK